MSNKLHRVILVLTAISAACQSAAQEDTDNAIISMDKEARESLSWAIEQLEKKEHRRNRKNAHRGTNA